MNNKTVVRIVRRTLAAGWLLALAFVIYQQMHVRTEILGKVETIVRAWK